MSGGARYLGGALVEIKPGPLPERRAGNHMVVVDRCIRHPPIIPVEPAFPQKACEASRCATEVRPSLARFLICQIDALTRNPLLRLGRLFSHRRHCTCARATRPIAQEFAGVIADR
jgi:hypothetical protein